LALNKEVGNRAAEAVTLLLTGIAYSSKGESSRALEFYQQALVIIKQAVTFLEKLKLFLLWEELTINSVKFPVL
jgi:tetratricopeptide (TPR) repeat protein